MTEEETSISIFGVSIVVPSSSTSHRKWQFLSSGDIFCRYFPPINRIFFFKSVDDFPSIVDSLKSGLPLALELFYPLAGRLALDADGRLQLDCNDLGVEFVEAAANIPFSELEDDCFQYRSFFRFLVRRADLLRSDDFDLPLLSIQVTKFDGGGVSIGIRCSHVICDSYALCHFVISWAELCRKLSISMVPFHKRTVLRLETLFPESSQCGKLTKPVGAETECDAETDVMKPASELARRVFTFTTEMLLALKAKAEKGGKGPFTTLEALIAHWWVAAVTARDLPKEQPVGLLMPMNSRNMLDSLPNSYFGNPTGGAVVMTTAGELVTGGFTMAVSRIHDTRASYNSQDFCNQIKQAEERNNELPPNFPRSQLMFFMDTPDIPFYETDFGWGRPICVRAEGIKWEGDCIALAGRGGGGVDVFLGMAAPSMKGVEETLLCMQ
eukprot:c13612_g1_i1 orf=334-1653(-)